MNKPATAAPAAPACYAIHDASGPAPHTAALQSAYWSGSAMGERQGYTRGWRWGLVCGAVAMAFAGGATALFITAVAAALP